MKGLVFSVQGFPPPSASARVFPEPWPRARPETFGLSAMTGMQRCRKGKYLRFQQANQNMAHVEYEHWLYSEEWTFFDICLAGQITLEGMNCTRM